METNFECPLTMLACTNIRKRSRTPLLVNFDSKTTKGKGEEDQGRHARGTSGGCIAACARESMLLLYTILIHYAKASACLHVCT